MTDLIKIGYWYSPHEPQLPMPVATDTMSDQYIVDYLKNGETHTPWMGWSSCRLCHNNMNGTRCLTDGVYRWPEGLAHYVEAHGVILDPEFINHITERV